MARSTQSAKDNLKLLKSVEFALDCPSDSRSAKAAIDRAMYEGTLTKVRARSLQLGRIVFSIRIYAKSGDDTAVSRPRSAAKKSASSRRR